MRLVDLPNELLQTIVHGIDSDNDINALARTCRLLSTISLFHLYQRDSSREQSRALAWGAEHDRVETARRSLKAGIPTIGSWPPLLRLAARSDSVAVMELLIHQEGIDLNAPGGELGRTPLLEATIHGSMGVLRSMLATGDVDPNIKDSDGETAVIHAARTNQSNTVELLIAHPSVDVNARDQWGHTPLLLAAGKGFVDVVERLLPMESIDLNVAVHVDLDYNETALSAAAGRLCWVWDSGPEEDEPRCRRVVELLLAHPGTFVDWGDVQFMQSMDTIYWWSAQDGHAELFRLLLARGVERNPVCAGGQDMFTIVARCGQSEILRMMLAEGGIQPDIRDGDGRSPLSYAAQGKHVEAMRLLLDTGRVEVDSRDKGGRTPLWWATRHGWKGSDEAIRLLLDHNAVIPTFEDHSILIESLHQVAQGDSTLLPGILLDQANERSLITTDVGRNLLSTAIESGNAWFVKFLLLKVNIDLNSTDERGRTVIGCAALNDRPDMLDLLLAQGGLDPNVEDHYGDTGLSRAARRLHSCLIQPVGHEDQIFRRRAAFVETLLAHPDVSTESLRYNVLTGLLFDCLKKDQLRIVELLITKDNRLDHNARVNEKKAKTLLAWAQDRGHSELVSLLLCKGNHTPAEAPRTDTRC